MTTYRLDAINYKDGDFHVRFIPNSEPIELVVSGKNAEKFFDALKANDYKTDKLSINTCLKSNGNAADEISVNVPCDSGCGTEPGPWIKCKFKSEQKQDKQEPSIVRRIQMGRYNGKPLCWIYLGHYDDETDLFLSEDIICRRRFGIISNYWFNSELAKWLSCEFSDEAFLPYEYRQLVPLPCIDKGSWGFKLFLLSEDEYIEHRDMIPAVDTCWWLRSQGRDTKHVAFVYGSGSGCFIDGCDINCDNCGVRPALRLRRC